MTETFSLEKQNTTVVPAMMCTII